MAVGERHLLRVRRDQLPACPPRDLDQHQPVLFRRRLEEILGGLRLSHGEPQDAAVDGRLDDAAPIANLAADVGLLVEGEAQQPLLAERQGGQPGIAHVSRPAQLAALLIKRE